MDYFFRLVRAAAPNAGVRILITDLVGSLGDLLRGRVLDRLSAAHPDAELGFDPGRRSGRGYYVTACFKIHATPKAGPPVEIGDGGFTDRTARLLDDRKERFLIGCVSAERVLGVMKG